jgi:hypothetical protein
MYSQNHSDLNYIPLALQRQGVLPKQPKGVRPLLRGSDPFATIEIKKQNKKPALLSTGFDFSFAGARQGP